MRQYDESEFYHMLDFRPLSTLKEGQCAMVQSNLAQGAMRRRLQDIGLVQGTRVECLQKNFTGDLAAYLIRGAAIALRAEDSQNILVS